MESVKSVNNTANKGKAFDTFINIATFIGAVIFGRLFGFLGIGAVVAGWFVYNSSKKKLGSPIAIIAGIIAGFAAYGLVIAILLN